MTAQARLQVHDVAVRTVGDDPTGPVVVGYDGTRVVLILDAGHAEELAGIIARADVDASDRATWDNTAVQVLAAKAYTTALFLDPVFARRYQP